MNMKIKSYCHLSFILILVFFKGFFLVEGTWDFQNNLVTNSIEPPIFEKKLPKCAPSAICGYLQANARGVNKERICSCENSRCPMTWDPEDGHSVTQGSDQYKFCEKVTSPPVCNSGDMSYTSRLVYSKITEEALASGDQIHCLCDGDRNIVYFDKDINDKSNSIGYMEFIYVCEPLPKCKVSDPCKVIAEKGHKFLVNRKCLCPGNQTCPTMRREIEDQGARNQFIRDVKCRN